MHFHNIILFTRTYTKIIKQIHFTKYHFNIIFSLNCLFYKTTSSLRTISDKGFYPLPQKFCTSIHIPTILSLYSFEIYIIMQNIKIYKNN